MKTHLRLTIAVVVLAAVVAWLEWPKKPAAAAPVESPLVKFDTGAAQTLAISEPGLPRVEAVKQGSDWKLTQPYAWAADDSVVSGVLSSLADITGAQDAGSNDAATFGLDKPSQVEVSEKDGATLDFEFGADSPVGGNSYLRVGANGPIKIIPSYVKEGVLKSAFMLQDKSILHFTSDQVTSLEIMDQGKKYEYERKDGAWPKDRDSQISNLLDAIQSGQMTALTDASGGEAGKDGLASPSRYLHLALSKGTATLDIGAKKGAAEYYARSSSNGPAVFTISDYLVQDMDPLTRPVPLDSAVGPPSGPPH